MSSVHPCSTLKELCEICCEGMKPTGLPDHPKRTYTTCTTHTPLLLIYRRLITMETCSNRQQQDHNNHLPHRGKALEPHLTEVSEALRVGFGVNILKPITHLEGLRELLSVISKPSRNPFKVTREGHTDGTNTLTLAVPTPF